MPRIAVFAPHYAEYTTRLALALAAHGPVLFVADARNCEDELEASLLQLAEDRLAFARFRSDTRIWRRLSRLTVAWRILRFRPDVVHVQEQPDQLTSAVIGIVRRFRPIVLTVHDPKPHEGRDAAYALRWDRFRRRIRAAATIYHVHGRYCQGLMESVNPAGVPVVETPHGVILTDARRGCVAGEPGRILFFGRMEQYKGLDILVEAAEELKRRGIGYQLVLAGRGPELERLKPRLEALPNVAIVHRYLTPTEAIEQFGRADMVVIPYREATQSGVVAAAFANGKPVVASRVGGLVDVVEHEANGLFVEPGSAIALADALQRVLEDRDLHDRLAGGARHTAETGLDWANIAGTLAHAYAGLIESRRAPAA